LRGFINDDGHRLDIQWNKSAWIPNRQVADVRHDSLSIADKWSAANLQRTINVAIFDLAAV